MIFTLGTILSGIGLVASSILGGIADATADRLSDFVEWKNTRFNNKHKFKDLGEIEEVYAIMRYEKRKPIVPFWYSKDATWGRKYYPGKPYKTKLFSSILVPLTDGWHFMSGVRSFLLSVGAPLSAAAFVLLGGDMITALCLVFAGWAGGMLAGHQTYHKFLYRDNINSNNINSNNLSK